MSQDLTFALSGFISICTTVENLHIEERSNSRHVFRHDVEIISGHVALHQRANEAGDVSYVMKTGISH